MNTMLARFIYQPKQSKNTEDPSEFCLDVDLEVPTEGVTAVFGVSGSGKTSFLRCVAGLVTPQSGSLIVNGDTWFDGKTDLPTHQRPIGFVFQNTALFPHLSVSRNLAYALKRSSDPQNSELLRQAQSILGIEGLLNKYPKHLSGGEKQRVAIARALLAQPKLLLLDEPLASLDEQRKAEILPYLQNLRDKFGLPMLYVSHSLAEVTRLANQVIVLENGRCQAQGAPHEVLSQVGSQTSTGGELSAILQGTILHHDKQWHLSQVDCNGHKLWLPSSYLPKRGEVNLQIPAKDVSLSREPLQQNSILNQITCQLDSISQDTDPAFLLVTLKFGSNRLYARVSRLSASKLALTEGMTLNAAVKAASIV